MGYYTTVDGEITITPPLTWTELKDSPFNPESEAHDPRLDVKLRIDEEQVDTEEGPLLRRTAGALVPAWEGRAKYYSLVEHTQKLMDALPGRTFSGRLECEGEEPGDLWRIVIRDGRAVKVEPQIVWPDDAE